MADDPKYPQYTYLSQPVGFVDAATGENVGETRTLKFFRPDTMGVLQSFSERLAQLPKSTLNALERRWSETDADHQIGVQATTEESRVKFFAPQTAAEEDLFVSHLKQQIAEIEDEIVKLQYANQSAHIVALEQQLSAYRVNTVAQHEKPRAPGALQDATLAALKAATTYCWAPDCVEAVGVSADRLTADAMPADMPLGEVTAPAATGWWWFERPIPLPTTSTGESVVALLWRRELREGPVEVAEALGGALTPEGFPVKIRRDETIALTWFTAFIMETVSVGGREFLAPTPTLAWYWLDGQSLGGLEQALQTRLRTMQLRGQVGLDAATPDECAATGLWLSKFWMAGGTWLDSRVTASGKRRPPLMGKVTTALPRQQARQLARQHQLGALPTVEVVYLRRYESRSGEAGPSHTKEHEYCWLVEAFPRRQWFPSLGRHQLIMVSEHIRGPRDRPLKHTRKIYAVNR